MRYPLPDLVREANFRGAVAVVRVPVDATAETISKIRFNGAVPVVPFQITAENEISPTT